jgi:NDP-sugar pyrophosphorylase family protein
MGFLSDKLTLFVIDENDKMLGTLTDGDIRRGLIAGKTIHQKVEDFMFRNFRFLNLNKINVDEIKILKRLFIKLVPVLNNLGQIVRIIDLSTTQTCLPIDAVLMAGGRGERLRPLTDTTPKPLLPVGNKTIVEHNLDHLSYFGIENIFISVRYLAEKIVTHLGNGTQMGLNISYVHEDKPLGTIGCISLIKNFISDTVLVMNSDLYTNIDLEEFYDNFITEKADMAVATVPYNVDVPYAILEIEDNKVTSFKEKPTYTYYANAGIYLFRKDMFRLIPQNQKFDVTDLMEKIIEAKHKVVKFPIIGYWLDIGKMEDYLKIQEYQKYLRIK